MDPTALWKMLCDQTSPRHPGSSALLVMRPVLAYCSKVPGVTQRNIRLS
jgi:hypothetical protein